MTAALILAAGRGLRLGGGVPKAVRPMAGKPLYSYSLEAALTCPLIGHVVLVLPEDYLQTAALDPKGGSFPETVQVTSGGDSRQQSVLRGLCSLPPAVNWVAVHDAARPLVTARLFQDVITLAREIGGALSAHPASDTVKRRTGDGKVQTLRRDELWHAETPQVFLKAELQSALEKCESIGLCVTDEAEAMELHGRFPGLYHNASPNPKISTEADWFWVETLIRNR